MYNQSISQYGELMKLSLNAYEVLALYEHLNDFLKHRSVGVDQEDLVNINEKLREHILDSLSPPPDEPKRTQQDEMFDRWEESVLEQLAERASQTTIENKVSDLLEEYDSAYPKSFKRSRSNRRKNKK